MDMIEFKWVTFAFDQHRWGCFFNILYVIAMSCYIQHSYIDKLHLGKKDYFDKLEHYISD